MLKTHSNPAEKDNLLSYVSTDKVMREQARKAAGQHAQPAPKSEPEPKTLWYEGGLHTRSEWERWKRKRNGRLPGDR